MSTTSRQELPDKPDSLLDPDRRDRPIVSQHSTPTSECLDVGN